MSENSRWNARQLVRPGMGALVLVALLAVPLLVDSAYLMDLLVTILVWAMLASAWNISGGFAGGLSLGHAAFFGVGAYTSTLLFLEADITPWIGMLVGALIAGVLGLLLGVLTLRLRGPFFVLLTLAFGVVVHIVAVNWRGMTRGSAGLVVPWEGGWENMAFASLDTYWYVGLALLAVVVGVSVLLTRSRLGYYLVAVREDEEAAASLGVRVLRSKLVAASLSAALTAVAGSFYAQFLQYIDPASTTQFEISVQIALVAIVGGMGTVYGPLIGAAIVIPLGEVLRAQLGGGPSLAIYGLLLMVIVLAAPNGIVQLAQGARRRVAAMRGVA